MHGDPSMMWQTELSWTVVLSFLGAAWFVVPWYAFGLLGALFVVHDTRARHGPARADGAWAWAVLVYFLSFVGLALYFSVGRDAGDAQRARQRDDRQPGVGPSIWRKALRGNVHAFAAIGLGIMVGRIIAHTLGMSFWQAFWLELLGGLALGWRLRPARATAAPIVLPKEMSSVLLSVLPMVGVMGAVSTYLTPMVATAQPRPWTFAFWGFGMLGLLVGFLLAYPMRWMALKAGWHASGGSEGAAIPLDETRAKRGWLAAMVALGCAALLLPAWLTTVRQATAMRDRATTGVPGDSPGEALFRGVQVSLLRATTGLRLVNRTQAALALDDAMRAAEVGAHIERGTFHNALGQIRDARIALQQGREALAQAHLEAAFQVLQRSPEQPRPAVDPRRYLSATVISPAGTVMGDVRRVSDDFVELAVGGWRNVFGVFDLGAGSVVRVPLGALAFGPRKRIGTTFVAAPTVQVYSKDPLSAGDDRNHPGGD